MGHVYIYFTLVMPFMFCFVDKDPLHLATSLWVWVEWLLVNRYHHVTLLLFLHNLSKLADTKESIYEDASFNQQESATWPRLFLMYAECFQFQNISHYCCKSTDTRAHAPNDSYCIAILFTLSNHYKCSFKATKSNFKQWKIYTNWTCADIITSSLSITVLSKYVCTYLYIYMYKSFPSISLFSHWWFLFILLFCAFLVEHGSWCARFPSFSLVWERFTKQH